MRIICAQPQVAYRPIDISEDFDDLQSLILSPKSGMAAVLRGEDEPLLSPIGAYVQGKIVGWAVLVSSDVGMNPPPMLMVYVTPAARKTGIGATLIQETLGELKRMLLPPKTVMFDLESESSELLRKEIQKAGFRAKPWVL